MKNSNQLFTGSLSFSAKKLVPILLLNFAIVALLGCLMRLKLNNNLNLFDFKHIQHSHSHFAFSGWVSQSLMLIYLIIIERKTGLKINKLQGITFIFNLICSYGMLISFFVQGYALFSILFSFLSIIGAFLFALLFLFDPLTKQIGNLYFIRVALIFNMLSALGTFSLAFLMANHLENDIFRTASIYFFLHFQYNGWFIFACLGIFIHLYTPAKNSRFFDKVSLTITLITALSFSLYLLSIYKADWLLGFSKLISISQFVFYLSLIYIIFKQSIPEFKKAHWITGVLFKIITTSFILKLVAQVLSTFTYFEHFSLNNRSIQVAYLHLIFLLIVSVFIFYVFIKEQLILINRLTIISLVLIISGFLINELFLLLNGNLILYGKSYVLIGQVLLWNSFLILGGSILLLYSQLKKTEIQF